MEPREIDRQIAEKVMGWSKPSKGRYWEEDSPDGSRYMQHGATFGVVWQPSVNIAHAFEVAEKMKERRQYLYLIDSSGDYWNAEFFNATGKNHSHKADTPSMAICLAALEAIRS